MKISKVENLYEKVLRNEIFAIRKGQFVDVI